MRVVNLMVCALLTIGLLGCSKTLLPREQNTKKMIWKSYDEVDAAYNQVIPNKTTVADLINMHMAPKTGSNVSVINYVQIRTMFGAQANDKDIPAVVENCLLLFDQCTGYVLHAGDQQSQRTGNVILDITNFHRQTETTGWEFEAFFIMQKDLVVYKLSSGNPEDQSTKDQRNPLGPFQNFSPGIPTPY